MKEPMDSIGSALATLSRQQFENEITTASIGSPETVAIANAVRALDEAAST